MSKQKKHEIILELLEAAEIDARTAAENDLQDAQDAVNNAAAVARYLLVARDLDFAVRLRLLLDRIDNALADSPSF